jgi:NADPH:quinone reductase-like Zn-dependent oxidoreductase
VAKGQRLLITGVAGGVGSAATQAAKVRGAHVIGTASARHNAYLKSIGVDEVIDYTKVRFEEHVKNVDAVIDTVGEDTAERAMATLKKGGMYISVGARGLEAKCAAAGIQCVGRTSAPDVARSVYEEVSQLAAAGKLTVKVDRTYPLAEASRAHAYGEEGHTQGKIVLIVDAANANRR